MAEINLSGLSAEFDSFDEANNLEGGTTAKQWIQDPQTIEFLKEVLTKLGVNYTTINDGEKLAGLMYGKLAAEAKAFDEDHFSADNFKSFGDGEIAAYKQADPMYSFEKDSHLDNYLSDRGVDGYMDPNHENHFLFKALAKVGKAAFNVVKNVVSKKKEEKAAEENVAAANSNLQAVQSGVTVPQQIVAAQSNNAGTGLEKYLEGIKKVAIENSRKKQVPVVAGMTGNANKIMVLILVLIAGFTLGKFLKIT